MDTTAMTLHIERLVEQIVQAVHPLKVIVFGSAARGQAGPQSDIDLLIIMPEGTHRRRTAQHLYKQLSGNGLSFDLLVATPSTLEKHRDNPGLVYHTILEEGWVVYNETCPALQKHRARRALSCPSDLIASQS